MDFIQKIKDYVSPYRSNKKVYEFYNCDEWCSFSSMNPCYNNESFSDTRNGKRALWATIKREIADGTIVVDNEKDYFAIRSAIIKDGQPCLANDYMKYGVIIEKDLY